MSNLKESLETRILRKLAKVKMEYSNLVGACHSLAKSCEVSDDAIFREVFPKYASERTSIERIDHWFTENRKEIVANVLANEEKRQQEAKRNALLEKLNLTEEEKKLLFNQ